MLLSLPALTAAVSFAAFLPTRGAVHQIIVGGPGILQFNPSSLVSSVVCYLFFMCLTCPAAPDSGFW